MYCGPLGSNQGVPYQTPALVILTFITSIHIFYQLLFHYTLLGIFKFGAALAENRHHGRIAEFFARRSTKCTYGG
jgi:hypothetical protein